MNFFAPIDMVFPANWNAAHACAIRCAPDSFHVGPVLWSYITCVITVGVIIYINSRLKQGDN